MPATKDFVHLHVHSHFSLLDGAVTIKKLVGAAKECGMPALALTDHGNMFGAVQFYDACKAEGVKPIIGMEAYIAPGARTERKRTAQGAFFHFLLLAKDEEGYRNLMKLSSIGYLEGFYYKPRLDKEVLREHAKGLIGSSACLSSPINRAALGGDEPQVRREIEDYRDIFDPGDFYLEIQRNGLPEQERIIEKIPPLAKEYGIPLIATNDVHYLRRDDARAQEVHLCINTGQTMDDSDRMRFNSDEFYFRNKEEMNRILGDFPEALENTVEIAERCNVELDFSKTHLPPFEIDTGEDVESYFRRICEEGCRERYPDWDTNPAPKERLEHEIGVIKKTGYISYFLITWDFIRFARENDVPVGPGRGSAAGSMVAYALGITNLCPLKYDLLFERFLNADRISMPDIDIDFCMVGRERVIDYVRRKYGENRVSQIITFGTMAARAVLRDVGRTLNIPLSEVDAIAKKIPAVPGVQLDQSLEADKDLVKMRASDPKLAELFDLSLRLEGLNRHASTHAAGVVIGDAPLIDMIPLYKNGDDVTSQWTMEDLERVGMLKVDFLGLRTLTVIDHCLKLVKRTHGTEIDIDSIPLDDPKTYDLLCLGEAKAVFQLESKGMCGLLRRLKPDRFEDIIALLALYRPGPIEGGMVDKYVDRKHGVEPIGYDHPDLEPILKETNGVILYQEQVMRIANVLAGFTLNEADSLRKAMGKKKKEIMEKFKSKFIDGAAGNGIDRKLATSIFDLIEFFAGYGFNKSHSTAYALVSYQTAYLKANYPTEFMAAVMTCEMSNTDKIVENLEECRRMDIEFMAPNINLGENGFTVRSGKIWYGLEAIKGVGGRVVDSFLRARNEDGKFTSIFDFCARVDGQSVNKSILESLVSCGAFDDFGQRRSQLMASVEPAMSRGAEERRDRAAGQMTFDFLSGADNTPSNGGSLQEAYPELPEWDEAERLSREKQTLGFYLTGHPLLRWMPLLSKYTRLSISGLADASDGSEVLVGAQISKITKKVSKRNGNPFWIVLIEDIGGSLELFVNEELYEKSRECLIAEKIVMIKGKVKYRDTTMSLRTEMFFPVETVSERLTRDIAVHVPIHSSSPEPHGNANHDREANGNRIHGEDEDRIFRLKQVFANHRGTCPVYLVFGNGEGGGRPGDRAIVHVGQENYVSPVPELFEGIEALCGTRSIVVNRLGRRG